MTKFYLKKNSLMRKFHIYKFHFYPLHPIKPMTHLKTGT